MTCRIPGDDITVISGLPDRVTDIIVVPTDDKGEIIRSSGRIIGVFWRV